MKNLTVGGQWDVGWEEAEQETQGRETCLY